MKKLLYLTLALMTLASTAHSQPIPLALGLSQNANTNVNGNLNLNKNLNLNNATSNATSLSGNNFNRTTNNVANNNAVRNNNNVRNNVANTNTVSNSQTQTQGQSQSMGSQQNSQYVGGYYGGDAAASSAGTALAASGPCIGDSYSAGVQALVVGVSASYISESAKCNRRELLRLMMGSPDPQIRQLSSVGLQRMYAEEFGNGQTQTVAANSYAPKPVPAPAAVAPVTSASPAIAGGKPAYCITASHGSAIWQNNCQ